MNDINRHALSQMSQNQQILYTAMMMNPEQIPLFNQNENTEALWIGKTIHDMFKKGIYNNIKLTKNGTVILE
jgi:hypothetical protein